MSYQSLYVDVFFLSFQKRLVLNQFTVTIFISFPGILHVGLTTTRRRPVLGRFPFCRPFGLKRQQSGQTESLLQSFG